MDTDLEICAGQRLNLAIQGVKPPFSLRYERVKFQEGVLAAL